MARASLSKSNDRAIPNRVTFQALCENKRQELASKYYQQIREKYQRLSRGEFLALRREIGMDRLLQKMGLVRGEFLDNPNFLSQQVPKILKDDPEMTYEQLLRQSAQIFAQKYGVKAELLYRLAARVLAHESHGDPYAVSTGYALGVMGLTSRLFTGEDMRFEAINPFSPRAAVPQGVKYLAILLKSFNGSQDCALTAYNAGPRAVVDALRLAFEKTGEYRDYKRYLDRDEARQYSGKVMAENPFKLPIQPPTTVQLASHKVPKNPRASATQHIQAIQQSPPLTQSEIKTGQGGIGSQPEVDAYKTKQVVKLDMPLPVNLNLSDLDEFDPRLVGQSVILKEKVTMKHPVVNDREIVEFLIPRGQNVILTGAKAILLGPNKIYLEAKFYSNTLQKFVLGWVPAEAARV
ncbi:MAG: lytic transglycosylase domain-containing protein [Patescibacteria group bacterium]